MISWDNIVFIEIKKHAHKKCFQHLFAYTEIFERVNSLISKCLLMKNQYPEYCIFFSKKSSVKNLSCCLPSGKKFEFEKLCAEVKQTF